MLSMTDGAIRRPKDVPRRLDYARYSAAYDAELARINSIRQCYGETKFADEAIQNFWSLERADHEHRSNTCPK